MLRPPGFSTAKKSSERKSSIGTSAYDVLWRFIGLAALALHQYCCTFNGQSPFW